MKNELVFIEILCIISEDLLSPDRKFGWIKSKPFSEKGEISAPERHPKTNKIVHHKFSNMNLVVLTQP